MNVETMPWLDLLNTSLIVLLFLIGLFCLLTRRNIIKQVIGLKIMLQGVTLSLVHAGHLLGDVRFAETMVISALIVEAVVIAIALALIVNVFRHYPSGDVDRLNRLRG
ncbi:MAG TPA: NADH-quinone oxidoreductase subunit K [Anaerolineae bacterium]|nr:NADH-quinone oxidoreductase subunit K [Anaerolineae bacterium]